MFVHQGGITLSQIKGKKNRRKKGKKRKKKGEKKKKKEEKRIEKEKKKGKKEKKMVITIAENRQNMYNTTLCTHHYITLYTVQAI